jgi:ribose 5-phosphate isomerase B
VKTFDIITEAEARVLPPGETVGLAAGGHITPLAQDTLKERRNTVLREGALSAEEAAFAPKNDIRSVAVASDHEGAALGRLLVVFLRGRGLRVIDLASDGKERIDYPDVARLAANAVAHGEADAAIVVDAAGIGPAIAANRMPGIRAATAVSETMARSARELCGTNVLTLGANFVTEEEAKAIVVAWLTTAIREPRYIRQLAKIR